MSYEIHSSQVGHLTFMEKWLKNCLKLFGDFGINIKHSVLQEILICFDFTSIFLELV